MPSSDWGRRASAHSASPEKMEILDEARDKVSLGMVTGGADTSRGVSAGWFRN